MIAADDAAGAVAAPMDAVAAPSALPLHSPQRLHPATLLLALGRVGPQMANMLPAVIALGVTGNWAYIVPAVLLFALISLAFAWAAWTRFHWQVGDDAIAIRSGVFSRNDRTIPFDRIQDVSIEQGMVQRLLGIATAGFETGSASGNKDDGRLHSIALAQAQALRAFVRDHRALAPAGGAPQAVDAASGHHADDAISEERLLFAMSPARLVHAGVYNFSLAIVGVLFGLLQTFDNFLPINPFDVDFWMDVARGTALEQWVLAHRWLSAVAGLFMLLVLGIAAGVARSVTRDWGFRLTRNAGGFRRTRGLTTRTDVTIPTARVQAALLTTGIIRRIGGWYDLKLQSLANDGKNESDHLVAPFAQLAEMDAILGEVDMDRAGFEEGTATAARDGLWHRSLPFVMFGVPLLLLGIAAIQFTVTSIYAPDYRWITWFAALSAPFMLALGWLEWRQRRWRLDGPLLHVTSGFLLRRHVILPIANVQSADLVIGPVLRRLGGATLLLGVPGGKGDQHRISALPIDAAYALRAAILQRP